MQAASHETRQIIDPLGAVTRRLEVKPKIVWLRPQRRPWWSEKDRRAEVSYRPERLGGGHEPAEPGSQSLSDGRVVAIRNSAAQKFLDGGNPRAQRLWSR